MFPHLLHCSEIFHILMISIPYLVSIWFLDNSESDTGSYICENPWVKKLGGRLIWSKIGGGKMKPGEKSVPKITIFE